ncbi:MAG: heavy-metal-associated domain-containing protein [Sulfurimonas sp.]|jgi:copper chaperone CopZ|nr:heavy-metal-associated domain-containing protein [Sulfurimonadaceae bacterium]
MQKSFEVLNVKCGGCANTIKTALKDEFGEVEINLEVEPRVVTLDIKDEAQEELLRKKLRSLGYPMSDEEMGALSKSGLKAKSFISCAIGKMSEDKG